MLRTIAIAAALTAAFASHASAQAASQSTARPDSIGSTTLEAVTVTAKAATPNMFSRAWHMQEDRAQIIAMMNENRRLAAQLHGYDKQIGRLEKKLVVVKARYDAKAAQLAMTDSLTADTRRRRMELEEKLRRLEGPASVATGPAAAGMDYALPADER